MGNSVPESRTLIIKKMKAKKSIFAIFASTLMMVVCLSVTDSSANTLQKKPHDYCVMKDGKMMCMKDGKMMPMDMDMTMKNGMKVMTNGECMDAKGNKMMMKEGEKMDMDGNMMKHGMKKMSVRKHSRMTTHKSTN